MNTETMTIHRALVELKTLDARILKNITEATFVIANKHSNTKINGKSIEDFNNGVKNSISSIRTLINRREALKKAVTQSNAITKVTISGIEYTVAEAIEAKKNGITLYQMLYNTISSQFKKAMSIVEKENGDKLTTAADNFVTGMYGNKDKVVRGDEADTARQSYIKANSYDLLDPLDVTKYIKELEEYVDTFNNDVDAALSVSNATTIIEFSYEVV